jgi:hypothetical protein
LIISSGIAPLAPLVAGIVVSALLAARSRRESEFAHDDKPSKLGVRLYRFPQGILGVIIFFAVAVPILVLLLPDSVVTDARPLFNWAAALCGLLLLYGWAYLKLFKITLAEHSVTYGAFFPRTIDLTTVTKIHYHWVNNGRSLRLYSGKKRIGIFEGGIEHFDDLAKSMRLRIPETAVAEAVGRASF